MTIETVDVLLVGDASPLRQRLAKLIDAAPNLCLVGTAGSREAALEFLAKAKPNVVLIDNDMRGCDAFEATRSIMENNPVPIVMCASASCLREAANAFHAIEAGALALVESPPPTPDVDAARLTRELLQSIKLMAGVKVVRRWPRRAAPAPPRPKITAASSHSGAVGIGASTGGPLALQIALSGLAKDFPWPILVVQHITAGFLPGLAEWLSRTTPLQVQIASHGIRPQPGHVYLAPDDFHLLMARDGAIQLTRDPVLNGVRPSVDVLFESLAEHSAPQAIGVLLTGMGKDGAHGLKTLHDRGAVTIAQDQPTSVIHGMPGAAIALKAASQVLPVGEIAKALMYLTSLCR